MNSASEDMSITIEDGIIKTAIPAFSNQLLKECFHSFLDQEEGYRKSYLQTNYGYAFDGYSYYGQSDSSNQAYDDLLETFVFSNFFPKGKFPKEFSAFFSQQWNQLLHSISTIESQAIEAIGMSGVSNLAVNLGHMVSCNYYPAQEHFDHSAAKNTRLSAHPDVSLLTIFPFGIDGDLQYETPDGSWKNMESTQGIIGFPGYLMELVSGGKIKALNHRVKLSENRNTERFSFAFFSLPFRDAQLVFPNQKPVSGKEYFDKYLNLF
ncbi:MAG: hypothetical protein ACJA2S_002403 [Cyclobacteriaceae bacterium]